MLKFNTNTVIIRIGWLYSSHHKNFVRTIYNLIKNHPEPLKVVNDQYGTPTHTMDVTEGIVNLIYTMDNKDWKFWKDIYHLSGRIIKISWYGFAKHIRHHMGSNKEIIPVTSENQTTRRPQNSSLDASVFKADFEYTQTLSSTRLKNTIEELNRNCGS